MPSCIYCGQNKPDEDMTLEHAVPQCLGGAYAPDSFKTNRACKKCNSNLGLFVDASFEKSWFVTNWLQNAAMACYDPSNPSSLPLVCLGKSEHILPGMLDDEICEAYLGPLGEVVYWVRPHDERLYWYAGGNPRTAKEKQTRAYFFFSERTHKDVNVAWLTFRDAFKDRKVKKILGTKVGGADPKSIGFQAPDGLDSERITYLWRAMARKDMKCGFSVNLEFDMRFLAKLARGIGFCLFGEKVLSGSYAEEVGRAIWHKPGDPMPLLRGSRTFSEKDTAFMNIMGHPHAVTIAAMVNSSGVGINVSVGTNHNATVMCAELGALDQSDVDRIGDGIVLVLFKFLQAGVMLTLPEYLAHKSENLPHPQLDALEARIAANANYFENLGP